MEGSAEGDAGSDGVAVQLGPCVGGRVRTWTSDGASRLWSVPQDAWLRSAQGSGALTRAEIASGLLREVGSLDEERSELTVRPRLPLPATVGGAPTMEAQVIGLTEPRRASRSTFEDYREVLTRAVTRCVDAGEFLVVEPGGPGAGERRFCLFAVMPDGADHVVAVETAPAPRGSDLWAPFVVEGNATHTISAPSSPDTLAMVPTLITEAVRDWDVDPWDLVFTYGQR